MIKNLNFYSREESKLRSSRGDIVLSFDFNNPLSPEKIGQLKVSDKAAYGTSFSCGANCLALGKNSENSSAGMNVISLSKNLYASSNSCLDNLVISSTRDLCFLTSSSKNSGAINSNFFEMLFDENTEEGTPFITKDEITTFASATNLSGIFYLPENIFSYLLANDILISSANSFASFSVSCDFKTICLNLTTLDNLSISNLFSIIDNSALGIALNSNSSSRGSLNLISSMQPNNHFRYINVSRKNKFSQVKYRIRASVNPTPRTNAERIRLSSGRFPLYKITRT